MLRIGNDAIVLLDHGDDIIEEHILEAFRETAEAATTLAGLTTLRTLATLAEAALRSTLRTLTTLTEASLRTLTLRTLATEAEAATLTRTIGIETIIHDDDARNGLALGNEVVENLCGVTLLGPAVLVLTHAVLQIQNGEFLGGVGEILGGQIDMAATHLLGIGGPVEYLAHRALRHVLHLPEVLILRRNLDATAPTAGTIVIKAAWIGH